MSTIVLKHRTTTGAPGVGDLVTGELALNTLDGTIHFENTAGNAVFSFDISETYLTTADAATTYLPIGGSSTADVDVRELHFTNQEPSNLTADGHFGYDASIGLMVYKTQNYGDAGDVDGVYMVLDTGNIATDGSLQLTGNGVTGGSTNPLTIGATFGTIAGTVAEGDHTHPVADITDFDPANYLLDTTDTLTGALTVTDHIKVNEINGNAGQQLILFAGESRASSGYTGLTNEYVYVVAETGLHITSAIDNWTTDWATGRNTVTICDATGKSVFNDVDTDALDVTGNITVSGTVDGVDIGANAPNWSNAYNWVNPQSESDLNTALDSGTFTWSNTATNAPGGATYGMGLNIASTGLAYNEVNNWLFQLACTTGEALYFREITNADAHGTWKRIFADSYHPNADTWTTGRTITLTGDVTGTSGAWDGSGNISFATVVANDSHTHDGRYYTESESDAKYLLNTSDSFSGNLSINGTDTSGGYSTCAIEVREVGLVSSGQTANDWAPAISFHWGGRSQGKLWMQSAELTWSDGTGNESYSTSGKSIRTGYFTADSYFESTQYRSSDDGTNNRLDFDDDDSALSGNTNNTTLTSIASMQFLCDANNNASGAFYWGTGNEVGTGATEIMSLTNAGNLTVSGDLTVSGGQVTVSSTSTRDKLRVWNSSTYTIGMQNSFTFGGLGSDYAMTFQMNDQATRGFWWGDSVHTNAQGAMALTTDGELTVAKAMRLGYGETDTTSPGGTYTLDVSGQVFCGALVATSGTVTGDNVVALSGFSGPGSSITSLNASNLSSGTVNDARLPATISSNITGSAATLTTARTLTIGSTGKTFNGSANVSWSLAEIGAQASGTYNTIIGTDTDVNTSGSTIIDSITVTDGVITAMGTRSLDAVTCVSDSTNASRRLFFSNSADGAGSTNVYRDSAAGLYYNPSTNTLRAGTFQPTSDERKKENITPYTTDRAAGIVAYNYDWIDGRKDQIGYIAQRVEHDMPDAVTYDEDVDQYSVNYAMVHTAKIAELEQEVADLKALVHALLDDKNGD